MRHLTIAAALAGWMLLGSLAYAEEIVPAEGKWNWLHPTDGVDPATNNKEFHKTFATLEFDDSGWKTGNDSKGPHGGFGYGEEGFTGVDIGTPEVENRKTGYFRHYFSTTKAYKDLALKCQRDDGLIIYLDGKEVARNNMPDGEEAYDLFANEIISGEGETEMVEIKLEGELSTGDHILALSLHQRPMGSSDLRIAEISLAGTAAEGATETKDSN